MLRSQVLLVIDARSLDFLCNQFIWFCLVGWLIWSTYEIVYRSRKKPHKVNYFLFESIPSVFTTLGLLGTFLGIVYGLLNFNTNPDTIRESIAGLLDGLKVAFYTSIFGISLSLIFSKLVDWRLNTQPDLIPPLSMESRYLYALLEEVKNNGVIVEKMTTTVNDSSKLLSDKLDSFSQNIASNNADAIVKALQGVIEDFNDTFKEFIESLVDKNFEELTNSVNNLNTWQKNNKEQLTQLVNQYQTIVDGIQRSSTQLSLISDYNEKLVGQNGHLGRIIVALENALVNDPRIFSNLEAIATELNSSTKNIQSASTHFQTTKEEITNWLRAEGGVQQTAFLLTEKLSELNKIQPGDLEILNNGFNQRLESTFKSLDKLMKEYIMLLEAKV